MGAHGTVLGLDLSTQSLSAVVLDIQDGTQLASFNISYLKDSRLAHYKLNQNTATIDGLDDGDACQPPQLFVSALDCLLHDIKTSGVDIASIRAVNCSAQQHGHVYLSDAAHAMYRQLQRGSTQPLSELTAGSYSYPHAPIWMTSSSGPQAKALCKHIGGVDVMILRSGSASPARFSGAVIIRIAQRHSGQYAQTVRIHLLSSWFASLLTGMLDTPIDYGNGSGTSLMDINGKCWDQSLLDAADELGATDIASKLPAICSPLERVGVVAPYFVNQYGFSDSCVVVAGSGDNPQSKVLVDGDVLSLGSSFVIMSAGIDRRSALTNAMYDGMGRPFLFGCRTNGALVWDRIRAESDLSVEQGEAALADGFFSDDVYVWQPLHESFPPSPPYQSTIPQSGTHRYRTSVESALALTAHYSHSFIQSDRTQPLFVTGGASASPHIIRRCAALWQRPVIAIGSTSAAVGAAVAGAVAIAESVGCTQQQLYQQLQSVLIDSEHLAVVHATDDERYAALRYSERLIHYVSAHGIV